MLYYKSSVRVSAGLYLADDCYGQFDQRKTDDDDIKFFQILIHTDLL